MPGHIIYVLNKGLKIARVSNWFSLGINYNVDISNPSLAGSYCSTIIGNYASMYNCLSMGNTNTLDYFNALFAAPIFVPKILIYILDKEVGSEILMHQHSLIQYSRIDYSRVILQNILTAKPRRSKNCPDYIGYIDYFTVYRWCRSIRNTARKMRVIADLILIHTLDPNRDKKGETDSEAFSLFHVTPLYKQAIIDSCELDCAVDPVQLYALYDSYDEYMIVHKKYFLKELKWLIGIVNQYNSKLMSKETKLRVAPWD